MMKIGKYEVLEEIGRGAMGVVYKAYDPLIGRVVAIKVISENALTMPEIKERFHREALLVGNLNHENITIVHDVGEVEGKPFLVMEYLAGTDLKSIILEKAPLHLLQKLEFSRQICKGLQYAHAHNIIHRDIKPENIKILPDGKIKIMDFGIARPAASELTTSGMMLGTPWYMSPEQIRGKTIDLRSDIFSFGVVLFELLMYQKPFGGAASTVIYSVLHDEPSPVSLAEGNLVAEVQDLLAKCLAKNADQRYRDCAALLHDLDGIIAKGQHQEQKITGLLVRAKDLFAAQKFHDAIPLLDEILLIDSTLTEAQTLHQQCLAKTNTIVSAPGFSQNNAGTTISRYRIITRLGAGGMGVIYKAEDTRLKRLVVLKFLSPHLTADAIAKERFIREAQAASALDHPNICTIYEIDETTRSPNLQFEEGAGQLFICMAYYEGQTLKEKLTSGGFPLDTATSLAIQIAEGLAKAHENGIVHRDIKPANIMITKNGLVKILDFGLAKLTGETRLTRSGMTAGTLGYLSPEQAQNREVDHRSDIWSLGVMLYQMTTGKLPFDGDYELAVLYAIVNNNPIPALQLNSNIPVELEQVINRTLQKSVEARFASMQEMLEELKHVQRRYYRKEEHEVGALSGEVGSLIAKGKFLLEKKEYPEALSRFKAALALDAKNQEVAEFIAVCERKQKEAQQIAKWLDTVKKQFEKGAYQSSLTTIQTVLMLEPDHAEAKNWEKKIKEYLVQSETVEKLFSDAEFYLRKEKFPQAREAYQEILKLEPVNKNATRGLERAEKSLQSRKLEAGPSQVTQLGQIDQPRALPVAKSKSLSKGLWVGLAGLVVVAAASAWFLWLRPDLQTPSEPSKPSLDFSQRAAAAKQEMLLAKAQAQQADAQRWASNTYQRAAQSELSGEQEAAQGIWGSASQAYEAATKLFKEATKEATNNAAVADLDMLKNRIKQVQQDMLREKMLAEKAGAPTKTKMLFEQTVRKEQEGNREFDVHQRSNYLNAQKLYGEARDEYRQIKQEALRLTQAAEAARQALLTAKNKIPGDNTAKSSSGYYAKAETTANLGMRQLLKGDYSTAITSFQQAQQLYTTAESELGKTALKGSVDTTKASMLEARGKVDKTLRSDAKYLNAEQSRTEGNNALMAEDFAEAIARYSAAKDLYVTVVNESNERLSRRADQEATAQREIQALIDRYKMGLEQRDLQALKTILGKTFMKDDEGAWTSFFKRAREIKPKIESNFEFIGNNAKIYLKIHLDFFNITNNEDSQSEFAESWLLEQMNGSWTIVERTRR